MAKASDLTRAAVCLTAELPLLLPTENDHSIRAADFARKPRPPSPSFLLRSSPTMPCCFSWPDSSAFFPTVHSLWCWSSTWRFQTFWES